MRQKSLLMLGENKATPSNENVISETLWFCLERHLGPEKTQKRTVQPQRQILHSDQQQNRLCDLLKQKREKNKKQRSCKSRKSICLSIFSVISVSQTHTLSVPACVFKTTLTWQSPSPALGVNICKSSVKHSVSLQGARAQQLQRSPFQRNSSYNTTS